MKYTLPLPPTLNATYKVGSGRFYTSPKAKDWLDQAGWMIKRPKEPLGGDLIVMIDMHVKYDRDIDSSLKMVLDLMQKMGVYTNDKQITDLIVKKWKDKINPRMEIFVDSLELDTLKI